MTIQQESRFSAATYSATTGETSIEGEGRGEQEFTPTRKPTAMPLITFVDPAGSRHTIEAQRGDSVMETAVRNGVPGIIGECGGFLSCASCHVFVTDEWIDRVGRAEDVEDETEHVILDDAAAERQSGSRLSCQVKVTDDLNGLVVHVAPEQS